MLWVVCATVRKTCSNSTEHAGYQGYNDSMQHLNLNQNLPMSPPKPNLCSSPHQYSTYSMAFQHHHLLLPYLFPSHTHFMHTSWRDEELPGKVNSPGVATNVFFFSTPVFLLPESRAWQLHHVCLLSQSVGSLSMP